MGKPATLLEFKTLAQTIDACYWECKGEISRETKSSSSNPPKPSTSDHANSHLSRSRNHRSRQNQSAKPVSASTSSAPKAQDLNTKLGKDRKLMAKECQRHFYKKLCLFCGRPGHSAWDCTKSTSHAAKGHAATVTPETKQEASFKAKKIVRNPPDSTQDEGCVDSTHAKELRLNAVALSNLTSLLILGLRKCLASHLEEANKIIVYSSMSRYFNDLSKVGGVLSLDIRVRRNA
jgi:hypothetical protein